MKQTFQNCESLINISNKNKKLLNELQYIKIKCSQIDAQEDLINTINLFKQLIMIKFTCQSILHLPLLQNIHNINTLKLNDVQTHFDNKAIKLNAKLQNISLNNCRIFNLNFFDNLQYLTTLKLKNCDCITNFSILTKCCNLTCLVLQKSKISYIAFVNVMQQLQALKLIDCRNLTEIQNIKLLNLKELTIKNVNIYDFRFLSSATQLNKLEIDNFNNTILIMQLQGLLKLQEVKLHNIIPCNQYIFDLINHSKQTTTYNQKLTNNVSGAIILTTSDINIINSNQNLNQQLQHNFITKQSQENAIFNVYLKNCEFTLIAQKLISYSNIQLLKLELFNTTELNFETIQHNVQVLQIYNCIKLTTITGVNNLINLHELHVQETSISIINLSVEMKQLTHINLIDNAKLIQIEGLKHYDASKININIHPQYNQSIQLTQNQYLFVDQISNNLYNHFVYDLYWIKSITISKCSITQIHFFGKNFLLQTLNAIKCHNLNTVIIESCQFLQTINIDGGDIKNFIIMEKQPFLTSLFVQNDSVIENLIGISNCPNLTEIDISFMFQIWANQLQLKNANHIAISGNQWKLESCIEVMQICKQILYLEVNKSNLKDLSIFSEYQQLLMLQQYYQQYQQIFTINALNENITELNLTQLYITNLQMITEMKKLQKLTISGCKYLTNFDAINNHKTLTQLSVNSVEIDDFKIIKKFQPINKLQLYGEYAIQCEQYHTASIKQLVFQYTKQQSLRFLQCLPLLQKLVLCDLHLVSNFEHLPFCSQLENLKLYQLSFNDLSFLTHNKKLKSLKIKFCNKVSCYQGIQACHSLQKLTLQNQDADQFNFLQYCNQIQTLKIINCSNIKNLANLKICYQLKSLNIQRCHQLKTIVKIMQCYTLEKVIVNSTSITQIYPIFLIDNLNTINTTHNDLLQEADQLNIVNNQQQINVIKSALLQNTQFIAFKRKSCVLQQRITRTQQQLHQFGIKYKNQICQQKVMLNKIMYYILKYQK